MKRKRERIGRWNDIATRQFIYRTDAGIEVDEIDHFEITRKRVFYDDILLVTKHRYLGPWFVAITLLLGVAFLTIGYLVKERAALITFGVIAAPFLLMAIIRIATRVDVVTVFGRRSRAQMRFIFRKGKARRLFEEISAAAREAQQRLADDIRAAEPPEAAVIAEQFPMPPEKEGGLPARPLPSDVAPTPHE